MKLTIAAVLLLLAAGVAEVRGQSVAFDPVFRVTLVSGAVTVTPADATLPGPVRPGHAYPFGTAVSTPPGGWAEVGLSSRDFCKLMAASTVVLTDVPGDTRTVLAHLTRGELQITLGDTYATATNRLALALPGARATMLSGRASLKVTSGADAQEAVFTTLEGTAMIAASQFAIPILPASHTLTVSQSEGRMSLRVNKGTVSVNIRDEAGQPQTIELAAGAMLKVFERPSPETGTTAVVLIVLGADGSAQPLPGHEGRADTDPSIRYTIKP